MSKPQINVTPLIDVLLVLLIIFMVITPIKPSAFDAKIPQEPTRDPRVDAPPLALVVVINADSTLRLNNDLLRATVDEPHELIEQLRRVFALRSQNLVFAEVQTGSGQPRIEKTVFIKAPRSTPYGSVAKVIDAVKLAGADPVSLQIDDLE